MNLSNSETATFYGPATVRNILARVTDGRISSINGLLASQIPGANLFLVNPAGITFGSDASISVSGSFFATSADYIQLGTDGRFAATTNAADSMLTVSDPSAFGFLTPNPGPLRVNGTKIQPGIKTLGLVGGDVSITGDASLKADDVQIVSARPVGQAGLQLPNGVSGPRRPSINAEAFAVHGSISVDGTGPDPQAPQLAVIQGQHVVIRGGTLAMKNAEIDAAAIEPGDGVFVHATGALDLTDSATIQAFNFGDFRGQTTVDISAGSATVGHLSQINTLTNEAGSGGDLHLTVSGALRLTALGSIVSESTSPVTGGDLYISAGSFDLTEFAGVLSQGDVPAKAGDIHIDVARAFNITAGATVSLTLLQASNEKITVNAGEISVAGAGSAFLFQDLSSDGFGGSIMLNSRGRLSLVDGGVIAATTAGRDGATVAIMADSVFISGRGAPNITTGITAENASGPGTLGGEIRLQVAGSVSVLDGGVISTNTIGAGSGGNIDITARDLTVTGAFGAATQDALLQRGISAQNLNRDTSLAAPIGNSGSVRLTLSGKLEVRDGGEIVVDTSGAGRGGDIGIATNDVSVSSQGIIAARTFNPEGGGNGGNLTIDFSGTLRVAAGGEINVGTFGSGTGGAIAIKGNVVEVGGEGARISAVSGSPSLEATGRGGDLRLDVRNLEISNDGQVTASAHGSGAGGSVAVDARSISISESGRGLLSGISAQTLGAGEGGSVLVETQTLELRGAGAAITTQSLGSGNSGRIQISADTISLRDGSTVQSSSSGAGNAGSIQIRADGNISLDGGSSFSVASSQSNAGDVRVSSDGSVFLTDSSITAQAAINGGSIDLRARDVLLLVKSQITAAAGLNGGNIFIDPHFVALEGSLMSANAIRGRGGNVRILSDFFFAPPGSAVTATSELGIDGTVEIDALKADLTGSLVELPSSLLGAESLLRDLCTMKVEKFSSFISEGRGGLPPLPGEALPSLMIER